MKISYSWLKKHFTNPIPKPGELEQLFTFHSFEVESSDDHILDLKILPDRANYCLSHKGVAQEVTFLTGQNSSRAKNSVVRTYPNSIEVDDALPVIEADIQVPDFCSRYMLRLVEGISIKEAPQEITQELNAIVSRSINNIVDFTNYVMFDIGQPLHAFDADKIEGKITVRKALAGEKITILDGKEVTLTAEDHVIADAAGPLAIAGVKGGQRAQITDVTTRIIIESARFDASSVRKTSVRVGIRNDSSKRFENAMSPEYAEEGMEAISLLIKHFIPSAHFGQIFDYYPHKIESKKIEISKVEIENLLGISLETKDLEMCFERLEVPFEESDGNYTLTIPTYRLDLRIPQDIVEEVGRIYGYDKIKGTDAHSSAHEVVAHPLFYTSAHIQNILAQLGFSEVYLYTLVAKGELEVAYPLASDKSALRTSLIPGLETCVTTNARNADLLNLEAVKVFEIGKVFHDDQEITALGIAATQIKKGAKAADGTKITSEFLVRQALTELDTVLGTNLASTTSLKTQGSVVVCEINILDIVQNLKQPTTYSTLNFGTATKVQYETFSPYPFIVRDIALFVQGSHSKDTESTVEKTIHEGIAAAGAQDIVARSGFFDIFTKKFEDGTEKTSYGYRLILQSHSKTLSDEEANTVMEHIYTKVHAQGWEVR